MPAAVVSPAEYAASMHAIGLEMQGMFMQSSVLPLSRSGTEQQPVSTKAGKPPRVGHTKSRKGCAQCKRRHVKCNEEKPCANCVRHGVACSLAGGPNIPRDDAKKRRQSAASSSTSLSQQRMAQETTTSPEQGSPSATASQAGSPKMSSPIHLLTGLIDRPPISYPAWQPDLQLMHHYTTHTQLLLADPHSLDSSDQHLWQVELPKLAFQFDFLLHALLGFSALHKAHLEPDNAAQLRETAVLHLDQALVLFRSQDRTATAENADAKFLFTWIVALFAYAIPPCLPPIDSIVELFMLVAGIDGVISETWFWVSAGPFAPILTRGFQGVIVPPDSSIFLSDTPDLSLVHLDFMLAVDPSQSSHDREICTHVLDELRTLYDALLRPRATASSSTLPAPTMASTASNTACSLASLLCFPRHENPAGAFVNLLRQRSPQALVLLAHYCVLLSVLESRWWMRGWAERVLRDVLAQLDQGWRHWVEWPAKVVLTSGAGGGGLPADEGGSAAMQGIMGTGGMVGGGGFDI